MKKKKWKALQLILLIGKNVKGGGKVAGASSEACVLYDTSGMHTTTIAGGRCSANFGASPMPSDNAGGAHIISVINNGPS